ncbi:MAG: copper chaperone PCu(A)C [Hyphomicrobium aestuarii]|nr:copper chaperone PCu(A)C [Hyphomicrobium aestuarii]
MSISAASLALVLATVAPAHAHEVEKAGITVAHPWARATPGGATVGAAYLEIKAAAGAVDRLIGASSPVSGRTEIHTHIHEGTVMKMRRVDGLDVAGGGSLVLKPSGDHIMLMDLKAALKEGDIVPIMLQFEKAGIVAIEASIEPVGAMGPHGMDHQPGHGSAANSAGGHGKHGGHSDHSQHGAGAKH